MTKQTKKPGRVKAAILSWLGVPIELTDGSFWRQFNSTSVAGQEVSESTVLQLSAVWACARIIAETISTLPIGLYERTSTGRTSASDHPLYTIIHSRPNASSTASVFWEAMIVSMLLRGNAFAEKRMIGNRLVALEFLSPARLSLSKDSQGNLRYLYTTDGKQREIPASRIFRIPGFTINGSWGLSAIEYGAGVFGSALASSNAANNTFENGLSQTVAFKIDRVLSPEQRTNFRESVDAISGALNAGKAAVLEGGMTADPIGINPKDAQLLESRAFSVEEICRWFRVPPHMVGHTANSTSWGTGIEQQMIGFLTFTLRPWLTRIEQAINKDLLSPVDQMNLYAEFSIEGLLRADSAGRSAYLSTMVNNGLMTRDEGRVKENLPPKGGNADVLTVQTALTPIDQLGAAQGNNNA